MAMLRAVSRARRASQPVSWASFALVALTGGGIVALYNHEKQKRVQGARPHAVPIAEAGADTHAAQSC